MEEETVQSIGCQDTQPLQKQKLIGDQLVWSVWGVGVLGKGCFSEEVWAEMLGLYCAIKKWVAGEEIVAA